MTTQRAKWSHLLTGRAVASAVFVVVLAGVLGWQALVSATTRSAPEQAAALAPANGPALARVAFAAFTQAAADGQTEVEAAQMAAPLALRAIAHDPLLPRAHAILAASLPVAEQSALIEIASALHRRNLSLQGQVLQQALRKNEYNAVVETVDQILRVNPEYQEQFFSVLTTAMRNPQTVPAFSRFLDGSADWHARFLFHAAGDADALDSLLLLRENLAVSSENFDRRLIAGLGRSGRLAEAERAYGLLADQRAAGSASTAVIDWRAKYWPFEWEFVDTAGFRAQASRDGSQLELFARPMQGGIAARRILRAPDAPFRLEIAHDIAAQHREDVEVILACAGSASPVAQSTIAQLEGAGNARSLTVGSLPQGCDYLGVSIRIGVRNARTTLSGTIDRMRIVPL